MSEQSFTIMLSNRQARIVQNALNFYGRSFLGQLDVWHLGCGYTEAKELERVLKKHICPPRLQSEGASYGIHSREISDEAREAIDIHDVIRHQNWLDQPEDTRTKHTVDAYPPYARGYADMELPVIIRPESLLNVGVAKRFFSWLRKTVAECDWKLFPRKCNKHIAQDLHASTDDIAYATDNLLRTLTSEEEEKCLS